MKTVTVLERVLLLIVCGLMSYGLVSWLSHSFAHFVYSSSNKTMAIAPNLFEVSL